MAIETPFGWGWDRLKLTASSLGSAGPDEYWRPDSVSPGIPAVRRIGFADLRAALAQGFEDFGANRTDVIFLCVVFPVLGLLLARLAFGSGLVHLLFPLASGFALVGPVAGIGLMEMSRRREQGLSASWGSAFSVVRSPSFGAILLLSAALLVIYLLWMLAADGIYNLTLGPRVPASLAAFTQDLFGTAAGWALIVAGIGVGFLFAALVLAIGVISFPMLLDRPVSIDTAVRTSVRAVLANPATLAAWGLIIVAGLVIGSVPFLLGLVIVLPVLGHATWHLYRRLVPR